MASIYVRKATIKDVPAILDIIRPASAFLKEQGINQWQGSYPNENIIKSDIYARNSYVLLCDGEIAGTASLVNGLDKNYLNINGEWTNGTYSDYAVIHRFAVSSKFRGQSLSKFLMSDLFTVAKMYQYNDIRVDTHPDNKIMQHVIETSGFKKVGTMELLEDGKKVQRFVYQLLP